jgi:hypothetical protein
MGMPFFYFFSVIVALTPAFFLNAEQEPRQRLVLEQDELRAVGRHAAVMQQRRLSRARPQSRPRARLFKVPDRPHPDVRHGGPGQAMHQRRLQPALCLHPPGNLFT